MSIETYPPTPGASVRRGIATVQSIASDGTLVVRLGGGDNPLNDVLANRLASYSNPVVGDEVGLITEGSDRLVLGRIATEQPASSAKAFDDQTRTITSTSYTDLGTNRVEVTVRSGASRKIVLGHSARLVVGSSSTTAQSVYQSLGIKDESGSAVVIPIDEYSIRWRPPISPNVDSRFSAGWSYWFEVPRAYVPYVITLYARKLVNSDPFVSVSNRRLWAAPLDR